MSLFIQILGIQLRLNLFLEKLHFLMYLSETIQNET